MADKTKIISFQLSDGKIIKVEVKPIGEQPVSDETRVFKQATEIIISGGYDFEIPLLKQWVRERAVRS